MGFRTPTTESGTDCNSFKSHGKCPATCSDMANFLIEVVKGVMKSGKSRKSYEKANVYQVIASETKAAYASLRFTTRFLPPYSLLSLSHNFRASDWI